MNENPTIESIKRFFRASIATAAGGVTAANIGVATPSDPNLWALLLTPALAALGKFLRTKWPKQLGWLPF